MGNSTDPGPIDLLMTISVIEGIGYRNLVIGHSFLWP
jgi:hypothetical protein